MTILAGIAAAAALFALYGLLALSRGGRARGRCGCGMSSACGLGGACDRTEELEEQPHV
ncbi:MAG TPA: hypothetical protein VNL18_10520 [Gemmatimonadales bacterium]|nr:hypothetical protein [Gemmatimonadales bacterium]